MRRILGILIAGCGLVCATTPVAGHHAFGAEFDPDAPIRLQGKVVKLEWVNPHAWIHIEVKKPDGTTEVWMVEGGTPNTLLRRGLTRESLKYGTELIVQPQDPDVVTDLLERLRDVVLHLPFGITYVDARRVLGWHEVIVNEGENPELFHGHLPFSLLSSWFVVRVQVRRTEPRT